MKPLWGIVGGMGALASAEFAKTIYEYNTQEDEQDSPVVILYSDPTFPDRTQAFLKGSHDTVVKRLAGHLDRLYRLDVSRIVLCCMTLHYALPLLPAGLGRGIVSLVDITLAKTVEAARPQLLLCSSGVRAAEIFQQHEHWRAAKDFILFPDEQDQQLIHDILYRYKLDSVAQPLEPHIQRLLDKYHTDSFIAGCSELHMFTKHLLRQGDDYEFIDPLLVIAKNLSAFE
jgi:aspartate racemase